MKNLQIFLSLILLWHVVYADDTLSQILDESKPKLGQNALLHKNTRAVMFAATPESMESKQFKNLQGIDKDSNDINQLNRKLEVEKVTAEIRKLKNEVGRSHSSSDSFSNDNAQTTVTGVAINMEGKKIAWLRFADGGSYTVNIGSRVGSYSVTDITMTGVTLSQELGRKKSKATKIIFLKRVYASNSRKSTNSERKNNLFFTPSPVITDANARTDYVPPIVPLATNE